MKCMYLFMSYYMEEEDEDSLKGVQDGKDPGKGQCILRDSKQTYDPGQPKQGKKNNRCLNCIPTKYKNSQFKE